MGDGTSRAARPATRHPEGREDMLAGQSAPRPRDVAELLDPRLVSRLARFDLRSRRLFAGKLQGERRSKRRGQSVEFEDFRNYVPGDDLRFIDWNVYARLDRLFVKIFLEEEDLALHLAVDASASMRSGDASKQLFVARLAAALGYVGLAGNNRVGVSVFGAPGVDGIRHLPDTRGRHRASRLGSFLLDRLWEEGDADRAGARVSFNDAMSRIARSRVGKGVMVILSDFFDPDGYERGLRQLAAAGGYDTYCLHVLSPGELDPALEAERGVTGDLRLTDVESGAGAEVTLSAELIRAYRSRLERFCADLQHFCRAREMAYHLLRSDSDLEHLLLGTLRRRGMLA